MIGRTMDRLTPESMERFHELLRYNAEHSQWKGLILTDSDITLRNEFPKLAFLAKQHGFEHVRIQTHGMRLVDLEYCRELVESCIDE